ncbi:hypothetical protein [Streptomyces sp. NPDC023838]|uniref:hypothetical protein n=1 Tax=Streptomyces sp. NPDC023838 TaxID=3154325 RepID=UPI0033FF8921
MSHPQIEAIMARWAHTGEGLEGRCFWCPDEHIVRDAGISNMIGVLAGLAENGELAQALHRLED